MDTDGLETEVAADGQSALTSQPPAGKRQRGLAVRGYEV
jgi:hypothetical protein